jgi:hypothetical protein
MSLAAAGGGDLEGVALDDDTCSTGFTHAFEHPAGKGKTRG